MTAPSSRPSSALVSRRGVLSAGMAALTATSLAACAPPGGSTGGTGGATPSSVSTNVANTAATITLFTGAGTKGFNQALADGFHKAYPKIAVKLQVEADNNYNTVLPRLLASSNPPDVAAPADLISAVKDNLVTNLDAYEKAYGWDSKIPSSILNSGRVSNGAIGSGSLYVAGGAAGPLVGWFYNRALAQKVGLTAAPTSIAQMTSVLAKAKSMNITPIIASNQDGLIGHLYSLLLADYMGPQKLLDIVYNQPGATLDTDAAKQATAQLQTWMKAGYFNSDANAINQDASYGQFAGGKGLFFVQGSWITQALPSDFAGKYGIFPMPPVTSGGVQVSMTGNSLGYAIAANSKQKNAAAAFLNYLTTDDAAKIAAANGYPSATLSDAPAATLTSDITTQIQAGYSTVAKDNGFTSWLQNSTSAMTPAETSALQELLAGKTTPDAMVASLQQTYSSNVSK